MTAPLAFEEIDAIVERLRNRKGRQSGPFVFDVEKGALIKFARAVGETNPLYLDETYAATTRFGGLIAVPTYVSTFTDARTLEGLFDRTLPFDHFLHTNDDVKYFGAIKAGDTLTVMCTFADAYQKSGRNGPMVFQEIGVIFKNQHDQLIAEMRVKSVHF